MRSSIINHTKVKFYYFPPVGKGECLFGISIWRNIYNDSKKGRRCSTPWLFGIILWACVPRLLWVLFCMLLCVVGLTWYGRVCFVVTPSPTIHRLFYPNNVILLLLFCWGLPPDYLDGIHTTRSHVFGHNGQAVNNNGHDYSLILWDWKGLLLREQIRDSFFQKLSTIDYDFQL